MAIDRKLYDKIIQANIEVHKKEAEHYDIIHAFGSNWYAQKKLKNDIEKIVRLSPDKKACDLGCGTGNVTKRLLDNGCTVTAVDLSESMLHQLKKRVNANKVKIFCMNIDKFLKINTDKYDIITINAVLHHMPDYLDTISKAVDHLTVGGVIYLVDGTHREKVNRILEFVRSCFLALDRKVYIAIYGNRKSVYDHGIDYTCSDYHCNKAGTNGLDIIKIKELINKRGLELVSFSDYGVGMYIGTLAMFDNLLPFSKNCFRLIARNL